MLQPFESTADSGLELGADALLFVMAHGHTISVPTAALLFAEKVGVISISPRDTAPVVLRDVNRALDLIAATLRTRDRLDREPTAPCTTPIVAPDDDQDGGQRVPLKPTPQPHAPISGARVLVADVAF